MHVLSAGSPAHVKLIVLVKPLEASTLMGMLPDIPAELMFTNGAAPRLVRNPGWIVKLTDCVLLLGLKLLSPPYVAVIVYWPASKGTIGPLDNRGLPSTEALPWLFNEAIFAFGIVAGAPLTVALKVTVPGWCARLRAPLHVGANEYRAAKRQGGKGDSVESKSVLGERATEGCGAALRQDCDGESGWNR